MSRVILDSNSEFETSLDCMRLCLKKIKIRKSSKVELAIFAPCGFLQRCVCLGPSTLGLFHTVC